MAWTATDWAFKTLLNKQTTDSTGKYSYNERGDFTLNVHADEIWSDSVPGTPPLSDTAVVELRTATLVPHVGAPDHSAWYAIDDPFVGYSDSNRLKDWISDKFDGISSPRSYAARLFSGSQEIYPTDEIGWLFHHQVGILIVNNPITDTGIDIRTLDELTIEGYRYIGSKGAGIGAGTVDSVGGTGGIITDISGNAPITGIGNLQLDLSYSPTWTGNHTHQSNLIFTGQSSAEYGLRLRNVTSGLNLVTHASGALLWDKTDPSNPELKISDGTAWLTIPTFDGGGIQPVVGTGTARYLPRWDDTAEALVDSIASMPDDDTFHVHGTLTANAKSFDIPHPTQKDRRLIHGCLEGPEHGVYQRGTGRGRGGVRIELPEYWEALTGGEYTVHLTSYAKHGVYVAQQDEKGFVVKRFGFDWFRKSSIEFSYEARASRVDALLVVEKDE